MENKNIMYEKKKTKSFSYRFGMVLLILAVLCWIIAATAPFIPVSIGLKTAIISGSIIIGEILFWVGAVLVGKEVVTKYKRYLNPKNWWSKGKEHEHENNQIAKQINQTIEDIWMILEKKERSYTKFKLNNQQHVLLTLIIRHPFSSPTELAKKMEISKSAVSQQLTTLEEAGYITRRQLVEDKRTYSIELAEKGELYKKEMTAFNQRIADKYQASLSTEQLTNVLTALQKIQELLD